MKEYYLEKPECVEIFDAKKEKKDVILRRDVKKEKLTDESGEREVWTCEEKHFRANSDISKEVVEQNFDLWWNGEKESPTELTDPTLAERLAAAEAAILELAEVMANG